MRRSKLLGLAVIALAALAAALATSAAALELPENLPALAAGETRTGTGKNIGNLTFLSEGQNPIECTAAKSEATETTSKPPKGSYHITLEGCQTQAGGVIVKCTGLGDATGIVLGLGTWALVFDRLVGKTFENLTTGVLALVENSHFTCGGLVLAELSGELLCLVLNPTTKSAKHEGHCTAEQSGEKVKQMLEWCKKDVGGACVEPVAPSLLRSVNHATPGFVADVGLGVLTSFKGGGEVEVFADQ